MPQFTFDPRQVKTQRRIVALPRVEPVLFPFKKLIARHALFKNNPVERIRPVFIPSSLQENVMVNSGSQLSTVKAPSTCYVVGAANIEAVALPVDNSVNARFGRAGYTHFVNSPIRVGQALGCYQHRGGNVILV